MKYFEPQMFFLVFYSLNIFIIIKIYDNKYNAATILHAIHLWHSVNLVWLAQSLELPQGLSLSNPHRKSDIPNLIFLDHVRKIRKKEK